MVDEALTDTAATSSGGLRARRRWSRRATAVIAGSGSRNGRRQVTRRGRPTPGSVASCSVCGGRSPSGEPAFARAQRDPPHAIPRRLPKCYNTEHCERMVCVPVQRVRGRLKNHGAGTSAPAIYARYFRIVNLVNLIRFNGFYHLPCLACIILWFDAVVGIRRVCISVSKAGHEWLQEYIARRS